MMVPLPCCTSNTVPSPRRAATVRGAEEIAAAVLDQAGVGVGPVGAVEGGERGKRIEGARRHQAAPAATAAIVPALDRLAGPLCCRSTFPSQLIDVMTSLLYHETVPGRSSRRLQATAHRQGQVVCSRLDPIPARPWPWTWPRHRPRRLALSSTASAKTFYPPLLSPGPCGTRQEVTPCCPGSEHTSER